MKTIAVIIAVALSHVTVASPASQVMRIAAPASVVQWQSAGFVWGGGIAPYSLIVQGTGSKHVIFANVHGLDGTSYGWIANASAGTTVEGHLTDSTGTEATSASFQVQSVGGNSSCLNK